MLEVRRAVIRGATVVLLSLIPVVIGSVIAEMVWVMAPSVDPLWRATFAVFFWLVGFAVGTNLFWRLTLRIQDSRNPG